jgi:phosphate transport system substrate-binding protein
VIVPTTAGCVALAYNLDNLGGTLKLPRDVYADIFLGRITHWRDDRIQKANPNLDLPDTSIAVVVRGDKSGTTFAFTNHLSAISKEWREKFGRRTTAGKLVADADYRGVLKVDWPGKVLPATGTENVAGLIQATPGSIGYLEHGVAERAHLSVVLLENRKGTFVGPTADGGRLALQNTDLDNRLHLTGFFPDPAGEKSYPIVTYTWLVLYKRNDPARGAALQKYIRWCLTEGQTYNEGLGYLRLPDATVRAGLRALESEMVFKGTQE